MTTNEVTVLGIGNILLGDEGFGIRVIEKLEEDYDFPPNVELVDGGTSGIDLLPYVKKGSLLIIVDAAQTGGPPGKIIRLVDEEIPAFFAAGLSPHQIGLPDLLATARLMDQAPARTVLIGIQPKTLETGLDLSRELRLCVEPVAKMVARELEEYE